MTPSGSGEEAKRLESSSHRWNSRQRISSSESSWKKWNRIFRVTVHSFSRTTLFSRLFGSTIRRDSRNRRTVRNLFGRIGVGQRVRRTHGLERTGETIPGRPGRTTAPWPGRLSGGCSFSSSIAQWNTSQHGHCTRCGENGHGTPGSSGYCPFTSLSLPPECSHDEPWNQKQLHGRFGGGIFLSSNE